MTNDTMLCFRVNEAEKLQLQEFCDLAGVAKSEVLRKSLKDWLQQEGGKTNAKKNPRSLEERPGE